MSQPQALPTLLRSERIVAVVGSRKYPQLGLVEGLVDELHRRDPSFVLISGGALGVDQAAENRALRWGHGVVSLRPRSVRDRIGQYFVVDLLQWLPGGTPQHHLDDFLHYQSFLAAAHDRNDLIAKYAHEGFAFWAGRSGGTRHAIGCFRSRERPLQVTDERGRAVAPTPRRPAQDQLDLADLGEMAGGQGLS